MLDLLQRLQPAEPLFCVDEMLLDQRARVVLATFDGDICHDLLVNPHPRILASLAQAGIRRFAISGPADLARLDQLAEPIIPLLRQPINSRHDLQVMARRGVRVFAIDHLDGLAKLHDEVGFDELEVEIMVPASLIRQPCEASDRLHDQAVGAMLRASRAYGFSTSIAICPGVSSGSDIAAALAYGRSLAQRSGIALTAINLGSAEIRPGGETIEQLCTAASAHAARLGLATTRLRLDTSRAVVDSSCSVVVQVLLRKPDAIYLNDGRFGWLHSLDRRLRRDGPAPRLRRLNGTPSGATRSFHVFGPTCDSWDAFETAMELPADVREGDWIEIAAMGADTLPWACAFNGLHPDLCAVIAPRAETGRTSHAAVPITHLPSSTASAQP
ncbi:Orn/DAP/Arg decarboxylase 2 [Bradyrhizobium oligotrophicum S58]|uniref:Orn/DAP/Arg decarboxylase 2 n=1 Tax=Bradyrhizobium oligotrophicum S58 TaxID=1245469 RepID=M5A2S9_9BRAD|nr:Orn/DAP/Arg decarboxylase 2 [Bradyrhizobium oligotrophicum]BAM93205.1 Orn/DAP/Arg decarboxylase 2 [Bradyrhizobium oligotrophicum S58]